jgi:hypothetical protein
MVFLSFTNVIGYIILGNVNAVIYFIIVSLFIAFFSRNMALILFIALIFTNLIIVNKVPTKEGFEGKEEKKDETQEKMKDKKEVTEKPLAPSNNDSLPVVPMNNSESFSGGNNLKGSKVDYASTVENAYDNLNKILGSDGIKNLTNDTQTLMKQQQKLAESMQSMTPLIQNITPLLNQTKDMLGSMNMGNIDQIASMITSMTGSSSK